MTMTMVRTMTMTTTVTRRRITTLWDWFRKRNFRTKKRATACSKMFFFFFFEKYLNSGTHNQSLYYANCHITLLVRVVCQLEPQGLVKCCLQVVWASRRSVLQMWHIEFLGYFDINNMSTWFSIRMSACNFLYRKHKKSFMGHLWVLKATICSQYGH